MTRISFRLLAFAVLASAGACAPAINHIDPAGPRFAAPVPSAVAASEPGSPERLRVVTFNVKYGVEVDKAITLLEQDPSLQNADVYFLQEMDEAGVQRIAAALNAGYVYYPATLHPRTHRNFGNAIVSRWPIEADRKIILPHFARMVATQRVAVGATLRIGGTPVRVYSVHLATLIGNGPGSRRDQLQAILADADSFPNVIVAGDFNSETVPGLALAHGYAWPTRVLPHTNGFWTFDHVLTKGLPGAAQAQAGTPLSSQGASDHRPVWAILALPPVVTVSHTN